MTGSQVIDASHSGTFTPNTSHACCRVSRLPTKDGALAIEVCSKKFTFVPAQYGKGSTSRPEASMLVLAPFPWRPVLEAMPLRVFDWKVAGLWILFREAKASSTSRCKSPPLRPERVARPRRSKFSIESAWNCICCSSMRKACPSLESLFQVKTVLTTASSRETPRSSLSKIRASWLAISFPKSGCWLQISNSSATYFRRHLSKNEGLVFLVELAGRHYSPSRYSPSRHGWSRMPQFHLLALAGCKPLPVVGLQELLPLVLSAAHHRCTASDFHWLLVSYPLCFQEGPTQAVWASCSVPSLFSQSGHKPKFYSSPGGPLKCLMMQVFQHSPRFFLGNPSPNSLDSLAIGGQAALTTLDTQPSLLRDMAAEKK